MLLHHTAYLMAAPGVQPVLAALYQVRHCGIQHNLRCARVWEVQPLLHTQKVWLPTTP